MAKDSSQSPVFPLELERKLFEATALSYPVGIPKLMLVAWRMKIWVEPLLYRTLVICGWNRRNGIAGIPACDLTRFMDILRTKSESFTRDSVENLMLDFPSGYTPSYTNIPNILAVCSRVENFYIILDSRSLGWPILDNPLPSSSTVPFRRVYCQVDVLRRSLSDPPLLQNFRHPHFRHLTHLELFTGLQHPRFNGFDEDPAPWRPITELVELTHLSFRTTRLLVICPHLLTACKALRALIILSRAAPTVTIPKILSEDPRFVMLDLEYYSYDWQQGVLTGLDYWARVDAFIEKRTSGEIPPSRFLLKERSPPAARRLTPESKSRARGTLAKALCYPILSGGSLLLVLKVYKNGIERLTSPETLERVTPLDILIKVLFIWTYMHCCLGTRL